MVGCWLLAAGCYWRWLLATSYVHLLRALAHVLDTHWCHPRKTQFFVLLAAALLPFRLLLLRLLVSAAAYWCLLLPAAACCCLRRPAACCWCCCWWLLLLWCCCRAAASKQLPKQETIAAAAAAAAALLRALAHVLDTHWCHINEKIAERDVWNPIDIYTRYIEVPNVSSDILEKHNFSIDSGGWRLLAVKQFRKNHLPGENTRALKDERVPEPHQKSA